MHRAFPSFQSNYPSSLRPLADYVEEARAESALAAAERRLARGPAERPSSAHSGFGLRAAVESRATIASRASYASVGVSGRMGGRPTSAMSHASSVGYASSVGGGGGGHMRPGSAASGVSSRGGRGGDDPTAEVLDLSQSSSFVVSRLEERLSAFTHLRMVNLSRAAITAEVLRAVGTSCPFLEELDISSTPAVPAAAVSDLVRSCARLLALRAGACGYLFEDAVAGRELMTTLSRPAARLLELRLNRCKPLTDQMLQALHCPPPPDPVAVADAEVARRLPEESDEEEEGKAPAGGTFGESSGAGAGKVLERPASKEDLKAARDTATVAAAGHAREEAMEGWFFAAPEEAAAAEAAKGGGKRGGGFASIGGPAAPVEVFPPPGRPRSAPLPLRCLDLTGCVNVTDVGVRYLASACRSLLQLKMQLCDQAALTSAALQALVCANPQLVYVDLTGCTQLEDAAVSAMAARCKGLQHVLLAGCSRVSDIGVSALATNCPDLVTIDLSLCDQLSYSTVYVMLRSCASLSSINITMCTKVEDEHLASFRRQFPAVTIVRHAAAYSSETQGGLVPNFKPPPKDDRWSSITVFSTYSGGKDKKGGKKKKK